MKKQFILVLKYVRAAGASLFVLLIITALSMTGLTVSYGRIKRETEKYDKLLKSGLNGFLYCTKVKPDGGLEEKIKNLPGVTDIITRPDTVNFKISGKPDESYTMTLYNKRHYEYAKLTVKGKGFDYEDDLPECIVADGRFDCCDGDVLNVVVSGKPVKLYVRGTLVLPQSALLMQGGGSSVDASLLYDEPPAVIVKDNAALRNQIGDDVQKTYLETMFIKADGMTDGARAELSRLVTVQSVSDILKNTKTQVNDALSGFLPVIIFCVLYSALTLVSMQILISYKTEEAISVCRCLGMSRKRLVLTVTITEIAFMLTSFLLSAALSYILFKIPEISINTYFYGGLTLPAVILGAALTLISSLTVNLTHSRRRIRKDTL